MKFQWSLFRRKSSEIWENSENLSVQDAGRQFQNSGNFGSATFLTLEGREARWCPKVLRKGFCRNRTARFCQVERLQSEEPSQSTVQHIFARCSSRSLSTSLACCGFPAASLTHISLETKLLHVLHSRNRQGRALLWTNAGQA